MAATALAIFWNIHLAFCMNRVTTLQPLRLDLKSLKIIFIAHFLKVLKCHFSHDKFSRRLHTLAKIGTKWCFVQCFKSFAPRLGLLLVRWCSTSWPQGDVIVAPLACAIKEINFCLHLFTFFFSFSLFICLYLFVSLSICLSLSFSAFFSFFTCLSLFLFISLLLFLFISVLYFSFLLHIFICISFFFFRLLFLSLFLLIFSKMLKRSDFLFYGIKCYAHQAELVIIESPSSSTVSK